MKNKELNKLDKLWKYAIENFTIYMDVAEKHSLYSIKSINDWEKIPYLSKNNYKKYQEIIFKDLKALKGEIRTTMTGGSSSTPTTFPYFPSDVPHVRKGLYQLRRKAGLNKLNRDYIHVWGHSHLISKSGYEQKLINFKDYLKRFIKNELLISGYNPTKYLDQFVKAIKSNKYSWIIGYSTALYSLARYIKEKDLDIKGHIEYIILTSENITKYSIELIESVFDCIVIKEYGAAEFGVIAYSSLTSKEYFFDTNNFYIEEYFINNTNNAKSKIALTTYNRVFPLIRYIPDDSFIGLKFEGENIFCDDVIGRDLEGVVKFNLLNKKVSGPINEVFIVHCLKTVNSIAQTTSYVDKSKVLQKLRIHYTGKNNSKSISSQIYKILEEEIKDFDKTKLKIEISDQPLKTIAGKSINYVYL
tara:strand:- start:90 stop:1337 length:1248 start_codon:yes stop_codon:yes gene_type:complete